MTAARHRWRALVSALLVVAAFSPARAASAGPNAAIPAGTTISVSQAKALAKTAPHQVSPNARKPHGAQVVFARTTAQPLITSSTPAAPNSLVYHNGPTERATSKSYSIFWQPAGFFMSPSYSSLINRFLGDVGGSSYYNILDQYYDTTSGSQQAIVNSSSLSGSWVDTDDYPVSVLPFGLIGLADSDIQNEVAKAISVNGWSVDGDSEFFVFTAQNETSCAFGFCSFRDFCAYHSTFQLPNGQQVWYANQGYPTSAGEDMSFPGICRVLHGNSDSPNGDVDADSEINLVAHELFETVTDPDTMTGWFEDDPEDFLNGSEIGDGCAWQFYWTLDSTRANVRLNGHPYAVQQMWSNADRACVLNLAAAGSPTGTVSPKLGSPFGGTAVSIHGSGLGQATGVLFGSTPAFSYKIISDRLIEAVAPGGSSMVEVAVATSGRAIDIGPFSYAPVVTSITPAAAGAGGGTIVTVHGSNLSAVTNIFFGLDPSFNASPPSDQTLQVFVPPMGQSDSSTVNLVVESPGGTSLPVAAARFTWEPPKITRITPNKSGAPGFVEIQGKNFTGISELDFGLTPSPFWFPRSDTVFALLPAGEGTVDVRMRSQAGPSPLTAADRFTYLAPTIRSLSSTAGSPNGGNTIVINGAGFSGADSGFFGSNPGAVKFGNTNALSFQVKSDKQIQAVAPPGVGVVVITIQTPVGASASNTAAKYSYLPLVKGLSAHTGPTAGGTAVTISGANLASASAVNFGTAAATFSVSSDNAVQATAPAGTGTVDVTVTSPGGTSLTLTADKFTYK